MTCGGDFCTLWKPPAVQPGQSGGLLPNAGWTAFIESLVKDLGWVSLRGPFLVPPRSSARMRLKEALKGLLPQTKPPSLRILPARSSFREAGFRRFLRKHPHDQPIPCQCAHWRGIEDHLSLWKRLPVAIACYRFSEFSRNAPLRRPTQWVRQITPSQSAQIGAFSAPEVP